MASILETDYTQYEFTEDEVLVAQQLTGLQVQHIRNKIAEYTIEKSLLEPSAEKLSEFLQQESYLRGHIDALKHLLACSQFAKEETSLLNKGTQQ